VFDAGEEMIVKREIAVAGRGRASINGSLMTVRELADAMDAILEIHGQTASHSRIAGQSYRELLDQFGAHKLEAVAGAYREWRDAASQLEELSNAQRDRTLRLDLLKYQIDEISSAKLEEGEEDEIRAERSILAHAREMAEATAGAYAAMEEDENSALTQLVRAQHLLQPLREIESIHTVADELQDVIYRLQELTRSVNALSDVRDDPARLEAIEERLATLPGLFVAGSGFRSVGIPDCVADGRAAAGAAAQHVRQAA